ncbi:MAG: ABC transporter ATP-binding protein, partial [Eubacteriales bacterium]
MARNRYDVDEVLEEGFDVAQLKKLGTYIIPYKKSMAFIVVIILISSALTMFIPLFLQQVMDELIPQEDMKGIIRLCIYTIVILLINAICIRIRIKTMSDIGQRIIHQLREDIFVHLQSLPFSYYDDRPHGKIQVRVVNYVNNLSDLLSNGIVNTITDLFNLILIIIFMLYCDVQLTLVALCGLPLLAAVIIFVKNRQRIAWQIQSNKQSNLNAYIAESINGISVTQSNVREQENSTIFNTLSNSYRSTWMHAVIYNLIIGPSVDLISAVTTACVYVIGIQMMVNGSSPLQVGTLIAFTSYIGRFWTPINTLAALYNSLLTSISYLERIFETIDEPVLINDCEGATLMPEIYGEVRFEDVCFSYEEGHEILHNINFTVNKGESYAIVGATGAGK